jgi:tRNA A37 methylthiotransferase MiaB
MCNHFNHDGKLSDLVSFPPFSLFKKNSVSSVKTVAAKKNSFIKKPVNEDYKSRKNLASICFARGCPRSEVDACMLVDYFRTNGWNVTNQFKKAEIILVATCGVTKESEDDSISYLNILNRMKKKRAMIFAFGCLTGINGKRLLNDLNIDILTRSTFERLDSIIDSTVGIRQFEASADLEKYNALLSFSITPFEWLTYSPLVFLYKIRNKIFSKNGFCSFRKIVEHFQISTTNGNRSEENTQKNEYSIRISTGCMESCSYCSIRLATGPLRSIPLKEVLQSFDRALNEDYHLIRLLGEDIGGYGQDNGSSIVTLLREVFERKDDFKIIIDDFHPRWLIKYFKELYVILTENAHRINHIAFPIQSGSNRILQLMCREYRIEDIKKCLKCLKVTVPDLSIQTHMLVGFPGETEGDFKKTIKLLESIEFSKVCLYKYSDRPRAPSQHLSNKIPNKIIKLRADRLKKHCENQKISA